MTATVPALWTSRAVLGLIHGPRRTGTCRGKGYVDFGGYVLALVPPGFPRMPNGIAWHVLPAAGEKVTVGNGQAETSQAVIVPGPVWEPVPVPRYCLTLNPCSAPDPLQLIIDCLGPISGSSRLTPDLLALAGRGQGLTPAGDDVLCGYLAGLVLWHQREREAAVIAAAAAARTTALSATLLRHAAAGELPGPAHALVAAGDPAPLRSFGHTSGQALMTGLALGCCAPDPADAVKQLAAAARPEPLAGIRLGDGPRRYSRSPDYLMRVPVFPSSAPASCPGEVISVCPPASANSIAASTFGPILPGGNCPAASNARASPAESTSRNRWDGLP